MKRPQKFFAFMSSCQVSDLYVIEVLITLSIILLINYNFTKDMAQKVFDASNDSFEESFMRFVKEFNQIVESQNSIYIKEKSQLRIQTATQRHNAPAEDTLDLLIFPQLFRDLNRFKVTQSDLLNACIRIVDKIQGINAEAENQKLAKNMVSADKISALITFMTTLLNKKNLQIKQSQSSNIENNWNQTRVKFMERLTDISQRFYNSEVQKSISK